MRPLSLAATALLLAATIVRADDAKPNDKTLGQAPPDGAVVLLAKDASKPDGWVKKDGKTPAEWLVEDGVMTIAPGKGDIRTERTFGPYRLHLEFSTPYMPDAKGQARGNSGVYLGGIHELQVLDSYGLKPQDNDCGAIYKQHAPAVNACKPPLQWQTYDVTFRPAVVEDGKVKQKARVTVVQNGLTIIDDKEVEPSPGGVDLKPGEPGPLLLQDHGNKVQYRNIWVVPLD